MKTVEGILAAGGGLLAGTLLGSFVLAPKSTNRVIWLANYANMGNISKLRDRLESEGYTVQSVAIRSSQMTGLKHAESVYALLGNENEMEKIMPIATQMMVPDFAG